MKYLSLALLFATLTASGAERIQLWGKCFQGMSPTEVLETYPEAVEYKDKYTFPDYKGSRCLIIIKNKLLPIDMFSRYNVRFYFNDDGLQKVSLNSLSGNTRQKEELIRLLSEKYGKPAYEEEIADLIRKEWEKNGTDVRFEYSNRNGDNPEIGIYYYAGRTKDFLENEL
ncbi:MAG: hypothetical protein HC838_15470 [Spirulinaceae cyanobacterium RM2_2_10]|nr:hypothetical protein [Spirulinaceae cyanobacterium RM2_2_10]